MWWINIVMAALLAAAIYGFVTLTRTQTRRLSRHTTRTAADMYDSYADSLRKQRRYAKEHGGEWRDGEPGGLASGPGDEQP